VTSVARGRFISLEGGEGTGKSTQCAALAERLRDRGIDVVQTREPGGSPSAELVRSVLLSGAAKPFGPEMEAVLFFAARNDHLETLVRPALEAGQWVITDRFADSTRAYQRAAGKLDNRVIAALERSVIGADWPDLTLILDLDPELGLTRAGAASTWEGGQADRFEEEDIDFHWNVQAAFRKIAQREPDRCVLVDASGGADDVSEVIWQIVTDRLLSGKNTRARRRAAS
jgi:dTMP kinase